MRSPMIQMADYIPDEDKKQYSDLQVMKSAAGYYIGTIHHSPDGYDEPGSRDTGYYPTFDAAAEGLEKVLAFSPDMPILRMTP